MNKISRGNASQFFVAGELCRRGYAAVVTMGNTPNTDVLVSNLEGTKFAHIQVKTFKPGNSTCSVGKKAEKYYGENFFWVLVGLPERGQDAELSFFIIPSSEMSEKIKTNHKNWLETPGKHGQQHNDNSMRNVFIPPKVNKEGWDISRFATKWDLIESVLTTDSDL